MWSSSGKYNWHIVIYIYIPVQYCTNVVRVLDRKTRAKYKKWQINSRFGLAYLLLFSFVPHNLCGTHQIKLPIAMKLQPLPVKIVAHRQMGGLSGNVNKKCFNRFSRGKPILNNVKPSRKRLVTNYKPQTIYKEWITVKIWMKCTS